MTRRRWAGASGPTSPSAPRAASATWCLFYEPPFRPKSFWTIFS
jgi:hypothetical protein